MESAAVNTQEASQYLTFGLGDEAFALDIWKVREVLELIPITKVPKMPDYMRGVINLRGAVVPVVDMKMKFGLPATENTINTCIIITEITVDAESVVVGALADRVEEVLTLDFEHIESAPKIGTRLNTEFIKGMGKRNEEHFIIILDIDKVFSASEKAAIYEAEPGPSETN